MHQQNVAKGDAAAKLICNANEIRLNEKLAPTAKIIAFPAPKAVYQLRYWNAHRNDKSVGLTMYPARSAI